MTPFLASSVLTLLGWASVMAITTPAFIRTLRHIGSILDVFRALLWFQGASRIALMTVGVAFHAAPTSQAEMFSRASAAGLSFVCAVATVLVAYAYRKA